MIGEKKRFRLSRRLVWLAALLLLLVLIQVLFDPFSMLVTFILSRGIRAELPRAQARWETAGIDDYDLLVSGYTPLLCILMEEFIQVRNGQAPEKPNTVSWQYCRVPRTVPEGFALVEEALGWGGQVKVTFDDQYGYVTSFSYDCNSNHGLFAPVISDCTQSFHIDNFSPVSRP